MKLSPKKAMDIIRHHNSPFKVKSSAEAREDEMRRMDEEIKHEQMPAPAATPMPEPHMAKAALPMAEGGAVSEQELEHAVSIAGAIMARRKRMAEGGQVDLDANEEEQPNMMDEDNEAILKENYDDGADGIKDPMDSDEDSRKISRDKHDRVARIMAKRNSPTVK